MKIHKLTEDQVVQAKDGKHSDGGGLYLQVIGNSRSWVFRYKMHGKERQQGLGSVGVVSLSRARELAAVARRMKAEGTDPLIEKKKQRAAAKREATRSLTFEQCATRYIDAHEEAWRNPKHRSQWHSTLKTYAFPIIGQLAVSEIEAEHVNDILRPIWLKKPETARRVRGRLARILQWAKAFNYRTGDNPAGREMVSDTLPKQKKKRDAVKHHPALGFQDLPAFMADLRGRSSISARALEFTILTVARTSEAIGATWPELDMEAGVWTVPASRMKAGKEHRVPLSARALEIVRALYPQRESEYVFAGRGGEAISDMAMLKVLAVMGYKGKITVHGFRSCFRDWVAECTDFRDEVAEMALAHTIESQVEAAYRRGDLFEKRRALMTAWADYAGTPAPVDNVVPLRA